MGIYERIKLHANYLRAKMFMEINNKYIPVTSLHEITQNWLRWVSNQSINHNMTADSHFGRCFWFLENTMLNKRTLKWGVIVLLFYILRNQEIP